MFQATGYRLKVEDQRSKIKDRRTGEGGRESMEYGVRSTEYGVEFLISSNQNYLFSDLPLLLPTRSAFEKLRPVALAKRRQDGKINEACLHATEIPVRKSV